MAVAVIDPVMAPAESLKRMVMGCSFAKGLGWLGGGGSGRATIVIAARRGCGH
jgi:hypothetical protein